MNKILSVVVLLLVFFTGAFAQDEITNEDLHTYALIDLSKDAIVGRISPMVNKMIGEQEGIDGRRFNELRGAKGDFASVEAKDWEIQFYNLVEKQIEKKKEAATNVVKLMASNALGAAKYKAVKSAIASDPGVKARYEAILSAMKGAATGS